jgi:hypothetical protein
MTSLSSGFQGLNLGAAGQAEEVPAAVPAASLGAIPKRIPKKKSRHRTNRPGTNAMITTFRAVHQFVYEKMAIFLNKAIKHFPAKIAEFFTQTRQFFFGENISQNHNIGPRKAETGSDRLRSGRDRQTGNGLVRPRPNPSSFDSRKPEPGSWPSTS